MFKKIQCPSALILAYWLLCFIPNLNAQNRSATISGKVQSGNRPVPFASIFLQNSPNGTTSDADGNYILEVPSGEFNVIVQSQGFRTYEEKVSISSSSTLTLNFNLIEDALGLEEVVVSATRNRVERKTTPVVVSSIKPRLLTATQSLSLADGLSFAPGVRVETNCQNCGFTQVRLNGLDGSYSQILLNSRPVFTSLLGVYGLEQIPTNTIERVEIVRSGGSALFGSNAIAGTVNIITKDPILNTWEIGSNLAIIKKDAQDKNLTFNLSSVADDLSKGITIFGASRSRDGFDANDDGFTEITTLQNNTIGTKAFLRPTDNARVALNFNVINEYRRGGDRLELAPPFTDITEELDHNTFIGGAEYEVFNSERTEKLQWYTSASYTNRDSYYGGLGGARTPQDSITANNAYGYTKDLAWVNGFQFTKNFKNNDVLTAGTEYNITRTEDEIKGYNRLVDQSVNSLGTYIQYEWKPSESFIALVGTRYDNIKIDGDYRIGNITRKNDVNQTAFSPRITLSYAVNNDWRFRVGFARGFRAPQAFNEDLHISSVSGEQQFVILSEDLKAEFSNAFTSSVNFAKTINLLQIDFLLEGFYTKIQNPFTTVSTGIFTEIGSLLNEVRNGENVVAYGSNFEFGLSPDPRWRFQLGGTLQKTEYLESQVLFESKGAIGESDVLIDEFVRVPNRYGYLNTSWIPNESFNLDLTGTYTGEMTVPLVISDTGFLRLNKTPSFFDLNIKLEYHFDFNDDYMFTITGGIKNVFDSYQNDFDTGAGRDSDYIYGPNLPRTIFVGLKFGKFH
ncbi:MAG: TonB-dependent receptor [Flavobacteriaceae bacterium]